jgi:hypothetical protein
MILSMSFNLRTVSSLMPSAKYEPSRLDLRASSYQRSLVAMGIPESNSSLAIWYRDYLLLRKPRVHESSSAISSFKSSEII